MKISNLLLVVLSIVTTVIAVEIIARVLNIVSPPQIKTLKEYRLSKPGPYPNSKYDIRELWRETEQLGWVTDATFGYTPKDFSGQHINIKNGYRRTTGNPPHADHRIWFYGGSTVICLEVPDEYTLPSHFAQLVNSIKGASKSFEIINAGASSITIKHQLNKLRTYSDLKKGDIVIFMDGHNDIVQTLIYQNPNGTMIQHNREQIASLGFVSRTMLYVYDKMEPYSAFVSRFLNPFEPAYMQASINEKLLDTLETDYFNAIVQANEFALSKGATFFHFLQPSMFTTSNLAPNEKKILDNAYITEKSAAEAYRLGFPRLVRANQKTIDHGIKSFDISGAFKNRQQAIFVDCLHLNEDGNAILAAEIYKKMNFNHENNVITKQ